MFLFHRTQCDSRQVCDYVCLSVKCLLKTQDCALSDFPELAGSFLYVLKLCECVLYTDGCLFSVSVSRWCDLIYVCIQLQLNRWSDSLLRITEIDKDMQTNSLTSCLSGKCCKISPILFSWEHLKCAAPPHASVVDLTSNVSESCSGNAEK